MNHIDLEARAKYYNLVDHLRLRDRFLITLKITY